MLIRSVRLVALAAVAMSSLVSPRAQPLHHPRVVHVRRVHHHTRPRAPRWPWGITPQMMAAADRVHDCEQPNSWANLGIFPGGIGMTDANWQQFRVRGMPLHAAWLDRAGVRSATPRAQARVLYRFADHYFGGQLPDQNGVCAAY